MPIDEEKVTKIIELRKLANKIKESANSHLAMCAWVSCYECPMNAAKEENSIFCLNHIEVVR